MEYGKIINDDVYFWETIYEENKKYKSHVAGWVLLSFILASGLIFFLILWVFILNNQQNQINNICFGLFGVEMNVDANPINRCGSDNISPCIFPINSLDSSQQQCDTLKNICQAFTFNQTLSTMKIVQPTNTFTSSGTNLFVRQNGLIS